MNLEQKLQKRQINNTLQTGFTIGQFNAYKNLTKIIDTKGITIKKIRVYIQNQIEDLKKT